MANFILELSLFPAIYDAKRIPDENAGASFEPNFMILFGSFNRQIKLIITKLMDIGHFVLVKMAK